MIVRRTFALVLLVGLCGSAFWGRTQSRWPSDGTTAWQEPAAGVLPLPAESEPASPKNPPPAKRNAGGGSAPGQPQDAQLEGQLALARLCERREESGQAEQIYRALVKKAPRDPRPHHRLGVLAVQKTQFAEAEQHFNAAKAIAPPNADLLSDIGYCDYLQQRPREAEEILRQALKLSPDHPAALNNLALVVGSDGRFEESLVLFKRANGEAKAYANIAYVLAQHGDLARAEEMYLHALTLDNNMRVAAQAMLQVGDRRRAQTRMAAAGHEPASRIPATSEPEGTPASTSPALAIVDSDAQTGNSQVVKASLEEDASRRAIHRIPPPQ